MPKIIIILCAAMGVSVPAWADATKNKLREASQILWLQDLNDEEEVVEGSEFELHQRGGKCMIEYSAYGETMQYHTQFEFFKGQLNHISTQDYSYKYASFAITSDEEGIEKLGYVDDDPRIIRLKERKEINPKDDPEKVAQFKSYLAKIPQPILKKYCE